MKRFATFLIALLPCVQLDVASAANAPGAGHAALGTSAAVDRAGQLWIAYAQSTAAAAAVVVRRSDDGGSSWQPPIRVNATPEPVAAEGENRPKLAFGAAGEIYVTWTSPTSAQYTGDIRFARSLDDGKTWSAPIVVHRDRQLITHRFESLLVDRTGRVWVAWIDKRDQAGRNSLREPGVPGSASSSHAGAAIYYAYSDDRGASWQGDFKLAQGSCECCRIALAMNAQGRVAAMWRHVFAPNERDHAFALLDAAPAGVAASTNDLAAISRVTFDRWRIDACPHHGPSLAVAADGTRHAVWFNQVKDQGRAFYGRLTEQGPSGVQVLPAGATHADIAVAGRSVAIAWKRFDGAATRIESWISHDAGLSFASGPTLQTAGDSDQPRLARAGQDILLVWRNSDRIDVRKIAAVTSTEKLTVAESARTAPSAREEPVKAFGRATLAAIERKYAKTPFWLVLWDLECPYCMKSLANLAAAQRTHPQLKVVTVATDPIAAVDEIAARLAQLGIDSDAYAFDEAPREALQFAVDATWLGEKPRAYRYGVDGKRKAITGVVEPSDVIASE